MKNANVNTTNDTGYKNGHVECKCGWFKPLGDGFNQYKIDACPKCTPKLETRVQNTVEYWDKSAKKTRIDTGKNVYFVLSNGIHVRYSFSGTTRLIWR